MMAGAPHRSYLFVPGNRAERFNKACACGAHAVIVDLEDAVPADEKAAARAALISWLSTAQPVYVRINAADTPWFAEDLSLCRMAGVAGIVLPKAELVSDLDRLAAAGAVNVLALIETARGFGNLSAIAHHPVVSRLLFGTIDFKLDMAIDDDRDALLYFRSQLVLTSRLAGIESPVDGVTVAIDDVQQLKNDTLYARKLGFGGKLCIHPKQVAGVNAHYLPTAADIVWARRVLAAADASQGAAVALDGKMIDRPVIAQAQAIIDATIG